MTSHVSNTPGRDIAPPKVVQKLTAEHNLVLQYFRKLGLNTHTIGIRLGMLEARAYRLLSEAREAERAAR